MIDRGGNRHHILFPRRLHEAHPDTKELRRQPLLIPTLRVIGHTALHDEVALVPPLDRFMANRVLNDFEPVRGDYIASMEELMRSIERAIKHPRSQEIERMNAEVAIYAIESQIPFVREHIILPIDNYARV